MELPSDDEFADQEVYEVNMKYLNAGGRLNDSAAFSIDPTSRQESFDERRGVLTSNMRQLVLRFLNSLMNKAVFLQFLPPRQIFYLSIASRKMRRFIDPFYEGQKLQRHPALTRVAAI